MTRGTIKTIMGPMFAGKTSQLMQDILWHDHQGRKILVIKPSQDDRYSKTQIVTHNALCYDCISIPGWAQFDSANYDGCDIVFIDEVQFMDTVATIGEITYLTDTGIDVVVAGLNQDTSGMPFETTAMIAAMSDEIVHLQAICSESGKPATRTQRLHDGNDRVAVGSVGMYAPRNIEHWKPK